MPKNKIKEQARQEGTTVLLVNAIDNPNAEMDTGSFRHNWSWVKAPADWKPEDGLPEDASAVDAIIVFSTKQADHVIRDLCESIHTNPDFAGRPLLVAVNQYEMPLANLVKEMQGSHFVFTPIKEAELLPQLERARESQ